MVGPVAWWRWRASVDGAAGAGRGARAVFKVRFPSDRSHRPARSRRGTGKCTQSFIHIHSFIESLTVFVVKVAVHAWEAIIRSIHSTRHRPVDVRPSTSKGVVVAAAVRSFVRSSVRSFVRSFVRSPAQRQRQRGGCCWCVCMHVFVSHSVISALSLIHI